MTTVDTEVGFHETKRFVQQCKTNLLDTGVLMIP